MTTSQKFLSKCQRLGELRGIAMLKGMSVHHLHDVYSVRKPPAMGLVTGPMKLPAINMARGTER